jgi:hypothetical protein
MPLRSLSSHHRAPNIRFLIINAFSVFISYTSFLRAKWVIHLPLRVCFVTVPDSGSNNSLCTVEEPKPFLGRGPELKKWLLLKCSTVEHQTCPKFCNHNGTSPEANIAKKKSNVKMVFIKRLPQEKRCSSNSIHVTSR